MIILRRPGSGLPIDSKVFRPIIIGDPNVIFLKCLRSADKCHGIWPSRPIMPLLAIATINDIFIRIFIVFLAFNCVDITTTCKTAAEFIKDCCIYSQTRYILRVGVAQ